MPFLLRSSLAVTIGCIATLNLAVAGPVEDGGSLSCSSDTGLANINDIRFPGTNVGNNDYLEVFILEQNVNVSNWQLCHTYSSGESCVQLGQGDLNEYFYGNPQGDDDYPGSFNLGTYLEYEIPNNKSLSPDNGEVLLVNNINGTNVVIDYIQYCQGSSCPAPYWNVPTACGFTLTGHDAGNKDIARLPDGTGSFDDNGDDVTRGDTNDDTPPQPLAYYAMDEAAWTGAEGDVTESFNNLNGTSNLGANTQDSDRAIVGNPGTCGYGRFDGDEEHIVLPTFPDLTNSFTITAWINPTEVGNDQRIFADDENNTNGFAFSLGDGGDGRLRFFSRSAGPGTKILDSGVVISADSWYFVTAVHDVSSKTMQIFVDGVSVATTSYNGTFGSDPGRATIGGETGAEGTGEATSRWRFNGSIDELRVYSGALNSSRINQIKDYTHPCSLSGPTHYKIEHNGPGITCAPTTVTITGHGDGDNPVAPTSGTTISLSTTSTLNAATNLGAWSGSGVTVNADQTASYTFNGTDNSVDLQLLYPFLDTVSINVTDGSINELEDPPLTIERAILRFSTINTQISGKPSNTGFNAQSITMQAIRAADNNASVCVPGFPDGSTRNIDFGAECRNPSSCAGLRMSVNNNGTTTEIETNNDNNTVGSTSSYTQNIPVLFGANATADLVIRYPDAGLMQLHAKYNISGGSPSTTEIDSGTSGSSNDFVVRPFAFRFTNINKGGVANPSGTANSGDGFVAAEDTFAATLSAIQWQAGEDNDANGEPDTADVLTDNPVTRNFSNTTISVSPTAAFTPAGGTRGNIGNGAVDFTLAVDDTQTLSNLTYDNVGSISLYAEVNDYLGTGNPGTNISGTSDEVGRFYPDHFTLINNAITPSCNGTFSYMAEPAIDIIYDLQAQGINDGPTSNYDTDAGYNTGTIALRAENNSDGNDLGARLSSAVSTNNWSNGSYAVNTAAASFERAATPDGPYQSLQLGLDIITEQDNRDIENQDMLGNTAKAFGTTDVRFGRLNLANAFGSELLALNMPLRAEYYGGTSYILNSDDNCTTRTDAPAAAPVWGDITLPTASYTDNLAEGDTTPGIGGNVTAGMDIVSLTAPGTGNDGSVTIDLAAPAWLQFDWDGDGNYVNDPSATATFGVFHGNDATIYRRELY